MPRALRLPAFLLGFALGGFADGILFHQLLQWHHLLSLWAPQEELAFQAFWDGVFHLAHYVVAALALVVLWRRRALAAAPGAGRGLAGWAWLGFGAWHVVDVVLVHWGLAMHRTRLGVADPLTYDLGLLAAGLGALGLGAWLLRRPAQGGGGLAAASLAAMVLVAGPVAALPPPAASDPAVAALLGGGPLPAFCAAWTRLEP